MKKILFIVMCCLCLTSCIRSKYEYEVRFADNDSIVSSGYIYCKERFLWDGQDTQLKINISSVEYNDTCKMLYKVQAVSNGVYVNLSDKYDRPLKVTKFKYIKE